MTKQIANKKTIIEVITISLLLIGSVLTVFYLQDWFGLYDSEFKTLLESKNFEGSLTITKVDGSSLFLKNNYKNNLKINSIKIGTTKCTVTPNLTINEGIAEIDITNCSQGLQTLKTYEVNIFTPYGIKSEDEIIRNIPPPPPPIFISIWNTTLLSTGSSANNQVKLPLESTGTYNFNVSWGDGTNDTITTWNQVEVTHTYLSQGSYEINITGTIKGFRFNNGGDKLKIGDIKRWGSLNVGNNTGYFYGCSNLDFIGTDVLDLTGTTDLDSMFNGASNFNSDLSSWDTSQVTSMIGTFNGATSFNGNISSWNTSSVTSINSMFQSASSFDGNLSSWDVNSVTSMSQVFRTAYNFNGDLSSWNTSKVTSMWKMFNGASNFNSDLSSWNTSKVTDMSYMFGGASNFNSDLSSWNTSKVTDMQATFNGASNFNSDLSSWDTSKVADMSYMFSGASSFNQNLSSWDVSKVGNMRFMFSSASNFNGNLSSWNVSGVGNMWAMFSSASSFNQSLSSWNVSSVTICSFFNASTTAWTLPKPNFTSCTP